MSETTLECQGLPCPQPVLRCKDAVERLNPERITVAVDNEAAKDNVSRFLGTRGYRVETAQSDRQYLITGTRAQDDQAQPATGGQSATSDAGTAPQKILVFISSEVIGSGDDGLGGRLMFNFLATLKEIGGELWRIILVNGGVRLAVPGSPCLNQLAALEQTGVSILVCGTCLEHFGLTGQRQVGQVTNMLDVVTSFQLATKTVHV
ncbi:MAG: sulfurtransferase-like selenium metabolism protein YedF [Pseudodesulfovibrio sp.]|nr:MULTISPECIES: sulfurtransferase-like selenium metabolism protein YedF [Pseudodesulfovibrio]MBU4377898.1 sulfurtransferase-like selenium metabolism protein YedF [Pseudomonadota bacterium]MBU4476183.1 sulfurtransferase-like selenium metabolism protein YedF [Pseudomonadota bacterium]MBU4516522.1 sulfurtransferase-like selenium metabolism protein YedF [Pseudomonadota bacterium]MBU4521543.1 sulfurtransferase-like selenium metabolism protein YedF [Pseudomonadota bacterium]MBU4558159.1 sulfurtrans